MTQETQTQKQTRRAAGPAFGNAVAYFGIWYVGMDQFQDPSMAVAMGGAIVAAVLGNLGDFGGWLGRQIDKLTG